MVHQIHAEIVASITEFKRNPLGVVAAADGFPVAVLNRNQPALYCISAEAYAALIERLEDLELQAIADAREGQAAHPVTLEQL